MGVTGTTSGTPSLPPLQQSWFRVTDDGNIQYALTYEKPVDDKRGPLDGDNLLSVEGATDITGPHLNSIDWGDRYVTEKSGDQLYDTLGASETNVSRSQFRSFDGTLFDGGKPASLPVTTNPELMRRTFTGRIEDAVTLPQSFNLNSFAKNTIRVPEIQYVGGPTAGAGPPLPGSVHLQHVDGFVYNLPVDHVGNAAVEDQDLVNLWGKAEVPGRISGRRQNRLVPGFAHRPHPALGVLRSSAAGRAKAFAAIGMWAGQKQLDDIVASVRNQTVGEVIEALSLFSWPSKFIGGIIFLAENFVVPIGVTMVAFILSGFNPAVAVAAYGVASTIVGGVSALWMMRNAVKKLGNAKKDGLTGVLNDIEGNDAAKPFAPRAGSATPTAKATAAVTQLTATRGPRALGAVPARRLPAVFDSYRTMLDRQEQILRSYRDELERTNADRYGVGSHLESFLLAGLNAISKERRLLGSIGQSLSTVSVDYSPTSPTTDDKVGFDINASSPYRSFEDYNWVIRGPLGGTGSAQGRPDAPDTTSATGPEPTHTFDEPGEYGVRVEADFEGSHTAGGLPEPYAAGSTTVTVGESMEATLFLEGGGNPPAEEPVTFSAVGSRSPFAPIERYKWWVRANDDRSSEPTIPDRSTSPTATTSDPTFEHTFSKAGEYAVRVEVVDAEGNTASQVVTITVGDPIEAPITTEPREPLVANQEVTLVGSDATSPSGQIESWEWTVRGPLPTQTEVASPTGETATVTFPEGGEYDVYLTVTDAEGNEESDKRTLTVKGPLRVYFGVRGSSPHSAGRLTLRSHANAPADTSIQHTTWTIIAPDGTKSTASGSPLRHPFEQEGDYEVEMTVITTDGRTGSQRRTVTVVDDDLADATDPDGDGLYEDVNGNGRIDFDDATTLLENIREGDQELEERIGDFDFDNEYGITESDAKALYQEILEKLSEE